MIENARTIVIAAKYWRHADELVSSVRLPKCADLLVYGREARSRAAGSLN
ncbi:transcriptional regulator (plasmid) [Rhizobium leguminosarum bv. viciae]|nr:transcriptional regulator [Rhizobium leguminosarum bv. viciae]